MQIEKNEVGNGIKYKDPAMAMVSLSRVSTGAPVNLFGSSVATQTLIALRIHEGDVNRHLNQEWYHAGKTVAEVWMTPAQFADMITSIGMGDRVPATFRNKNGELLEPPKMPTKSEQFKDEVAEDINRFEINLDDLQKKVSAMFNSGKANKGQLKEISDSLFHLKKLADDHLPFVLDQFGRHMERTVHEAKKEVEAFVTQVVTKTGLEALKDRAVTLQIEGHGEGDKG